MITAERHLPTTSHGNLIYLMEIKELVNSKYFTFNFIFLSLVRKVLRDSHFVTITMLNTKVVLCPYEGIIRTGNSNNVKVVSLIITND